MEQFLRVATFVIVTIILLICLLASGGCSTVKQQPQQSQPQSQPQAATSDNKNERGIESIFYVAEGNRPANINVTHSTFNVTVEQGRQGTQTDQAATASAAATGENTATPTNKVDTAVEIPVSLTK